jgi:hypothetical protein
MTAKELFLDFLEICPLDEYRPQTKIYIMSNIFEDDFYASLGLLCSKLELKIHKMNNDVRFLHTKEIWLTCENGIWKTKTTGRVIKTGKIRECMIAAGIDYKTHHENIQNPRWIPSQDWTIPNMGRDHK